MFEKSWVKNTAPNILKYVRVGYFTSFWGNWTYHSQSMKVVRCKVIIKRDNKMYCFEWIVELPNVDILQVQEERQLGNEFCL